MRRNIIVKNIFLYFVLTLISVVILFPVFWTFRSSLMRSGQIFKLPIVWLPSPFTLDNYKKLVVTANIIRPFFNSAVVVFLGVSGTVITSTICAYGFARFKWKFKNLVFQLLMTSIFIPSAVTLIPTFIMWKYLNGYGSIIPLVLPAWFGGGLFNIFLLRQFFMTLPLELDESAYIDGAGPITILVRILVPLIKPATITVALFSAVYYWNDFLNPLLYLNEEKKYTMSIALWGISGMYQSDWGMLMSAGVFMFIPMIIVFLIAQKYFTEGIAVTGLKY